MTADTDKTLDFYENVGTKEEGYEMVTMEVVKKQLKMAGFSNRFLGWSAAAQLPAILNDNEIIERVATGIYDGGHALIVATNKRILFIDKKPISCHIEDVHYEMVAEIEHNLGPAIGKLRIYCLSKKIELTSVNKAQIRQFAMFVENKVNQVRLNMQNWGQMLDAAQESAQGAPKPSHVPQVFPINFNE